MESIKIRTMRRVVAVYYLRKVLNLVTVKFVILALGAFAFGALVHVAAVFENMPALSNVGGFSTFSYYAFLHTEIAVQATIIALAVVTLWLIRDILKGIVPSAQIGLRHA